MNGIDVVNIRLVKDKTLYSQTPIINTKTAADVLAEELRYYDREVLAVVNLQSDLKPININIVSMGLVNATIASPSQIFKSAILSNASCIMMLHNNPSGTVTPSKPDIDVTKRILLCGKLMGIELIDHIIVGDNERYSFAEEGMIEKFKKEVNQSLITQKSSVFEKMVMQPAEIYPEVQIEF